MPPKGPNTEELRRRLDDLTTSWMVDQSRPAPETLRELSAALAAAREQAEAAGMPEAATLAASLSGAVSVAADDTSSDLTRLNEALSKGLDDLEKVMAPSSTAAPEEAARAVPAPASNPIAHDPELLNDVILESTEHLASIENELLNLERDSTNHEAIHTIFRSFHTIKGLAGFLELAEIQQVAHHVESLLDEARNGRLRITSGVADVILAGKDYLERAFRQLATAANGGTRQPFADHRPLIEQICKAGAAACDAPAAEERAAPQPEAMAQPETAGPDADAIVATAAQTGRNESRTVKVDTAKLDYMVEMIGELVIAQSQVQHDPHLSTIESPRLHRNVAQLARTTAELQRIGLAMRMVPVGHLFRRMIRLVRDLSRRAGKQAEIEIIGEDTQLDRTIVEELGDPLVHMIRNSVDHGLEKAEDRIACGKEAAGRVRLRASHQAGHILIEISDDGRGIDREKVLAKARTKGLVGEGAHIPDNEILNLIFEPGFSTAERVTDVSGRGVGMDVVRKQVQKLRGRIEIQSTPGKGTTFLLKLPLTLAIIDGLVIGVGRERYIVPLFAVRETFRPKPEMISTVCGRGEVALIRGQLLPVARLYRRFGVKPRTEDPCDAVFIVAENRGRFVCLMVDEFIGKQEVVLKSLGETLKNIPGVAGGAILGDGRVGLVLDLDGICDRVHE
jgi:two-component system, chemotaxis family, sensor kinase CheA